MTWRLLLSVVAGVFVTGCGPGTTDVPGPSRVDVVLADDTGKKLAGFCEVLAPADKAQTFAWPDLDGANPATVDGWQWVSLWATWCEPCLAEMPMIERWDTKLASEGVPVTIQHVSVDATSEDLTAFRAKHDDAPTGPRVADQAAVEPWLTSLGLDRGAAIPIHVFVDASDKVRCVRVGAVSEGDYRTVKHLLAGE
jgi:thiol-disulfide isomerase/thioredoxin